MGGVYQQRWCNKTSNCRIFMELSSRKSGFGPRRPSYHHRIFRDSQGRQGQCENRQAAGGEMVHTSTSDAWHFAVSCEATWSWIRKIRMWGDSCHSCLWMVSQLMGISIIGVLPSKDMSCTSTRYLQSPALKSCSALAVDVIFDLEYCPLTGMHPQWKYPNNEPKKEQIQY